MKTLEVKENGAEDSERGFLRTMGPHLTCGLCAGYLIDATTLSECMHSFCRSCIVQYLDRYASCPTCGVHLIRSRSCEQLRPDPVLQSVVYKVVPGLYQEELRRRHDFYKERPHYVEASQVPLVPTLGPSTFYSPSDPISLSLDYLAESEIQTDLAEDVPSEAIKRRYFRCPAAVTVHHFQKLLSLKFDLQSSHKVQIVCCGEVLPASFRLLDIAYVYKWTQETPLKLYYQIVSAAASPPPVLDEATHSESQLPQGVVNMPPPQVPPLITTPFLKPPVPPLRKKHKKSSHHRRHHHHQTHPKLSEVKAKESTPAKTAPLLSKEPEEPNLPLAPPPAATDRKRLAPMTPVSSLPPRRKKSKRSKVKKVKSEHKNSPLPRGSMVQAIHQLLKKKLRVSQEKVAVDQVPLPARKRASSQCEAVTTGGPPEKIRKTQSISVDSGPFLPPPEVSLGPESPQLEVPPPKVEDYKPPPGGSKLGLLVAAAEVANTCTLLNGDPALPDPSSTPGEPLLSIPEAEISKPERVESDSASKEVPAESSAPTSLEVEVSSHNSDDSKDEDALVVDEADTHDSNGALDLSTKSRRLPDASPSSTECVMPPKDPSQEAKDLKDNKLAAIDLIIPSTAKLTARKSTHHSSLHIYPSPSPSPSPNSLHPPDDSSPPNSVTIMELSVPSIPSRLNGSIALGNNRLAPSQKLTSIADSLAQRQHHLLSLKLSHQHPPAPPATTSTERFIVRPNPATVRPSQRPQKTSRPHPPYATQPSDALRNLLTLSQTAALVSRAPPLPLPLFGDGSPNRTSTTVTSSAQKLLQTLRNNVASSLNNPYRPPNHLPSGGFNRTALNPSSSPNLTLGPTSPASGGRILPANTSALTFRLSQQGITVRATVPTKKAASEPLMHHLHRPNRSIRHIPNPSLLQQRRLANNSAVSVSTPFPHATPPAPPNVTLASEPPKLSTT